MTTQAARPAHGWFTARDEPPTHAGFRAILGRSVGAWDEFETYLADTYGLRGGLHFMYGERYGWALQFRRGGRLILAMYPNRGHFTLQVILSRAQVEAATTMALPGSVTRALAAARPYPEGRWLFIPVRSREGARELRPLVALKMSRPAAGGKAEGVRRKASSL